MILKYKLSALFENVSAQSIALFRIFFGVIMLWEVYKYFDRGWIRRYWVEPEFNFKYEWFQWVEPLSADGMIFLFMILGLLSLFVTIGLFYRVSIFLLFILFTYTFLLEQARYLNHFYLVICINFLLIFVPAHRTFSVDSWLFPNRENGYIDRWHILILKFQVGVAYFFGGIAKLNSNWLSGSPLDMWLSRRSEFPVIGTLLELKEVALFVSYSGLFLDLLALPLLLVKRTRPYMALMLVLFHFTNDALFTIGIFPWLMIGALTIYLPEDWPKRAVNYVAEKSLNQKLSIFTIGLISAYIGSWFHGGFSLIPFTTSFFITVVLFWDFHINPSTNRATKPQKSNLLVQKWIAAGIMFWVLIQCIVPMRHLIIEGNPSWTEEGHRFAWHMKLRSKSCSEQFYVENRNTGELVEINGMPFLENWQRRKVSASPQLVIQYASFLSEINDNQPVYADIHCSLNGGPSRRLVRADVDLSKVQFNDWKKNDWILRY